MYNYIQKIDFFLLARFIASVFVIRQHVDFEGYTIHAFGFTHNVFGNIDAGTYAVKFFFYSIRLSNGQNFKLKIFDYH
jgi:hypothetical protein